MDTLHKVWKAMRPYVRELGRFIRHVLVALLQRTSFVGWVIVIVGFALFVSLPTWARDLILLALMLVIIYDRFDPDKDTRVGYAAMNRVLGLERYLSSIGVIGMQAPVPTAPVANLESEPPINEADTKPHPAVDA